MTYHLPRHRFSQEMNLSSDTNQNATSSYELNLPIAYTVFEACVAVSAVLGNLLVIVVFLQDRRLRKITNFYIIR